MTAAEGESAACAPTPSDPIAAALVALLAALAPQHDARLAEQLIESAASLISDQPATLDLKIASAALEEMRQAFLVFAPWRDQPKVTIFGSARTQPNDPLYAQARDVAARLAAEGWMVVTGAGPGIMRAGMEGAGRDHSIGVSIRLPFEQGANPIIAGDEKYVSMKYFFTRKLMLIKESRGFVCLPGGFGTLDETFELLTLTQTGKGLPVPIVFLDTPGDPYWERVHEFVLDQLVKRGLVAQPDTNLYFITDDCDAAVDEVLRFYRNYDSLRYVGEQLVLRVKQAPSPDQLTQLNDRFGHLCSSGSITVVEPFGVERREDDRLTMQRVSFAFAKHGYGDLRALINMLNAFATESLED